MHRISVYVADDHPLYREGVVRAVRGRPDLELAGEATDGDAALEEIARLRPDVALLDQRLPGMQGLDVLAELDRRGIPTRVVLLTAATDSELVYEAIALGAAGYLSKEATREEICDAVAAAAGGETQVSVALQHGLAEQIQRRRGGIRAALSAREREVLELIAQGHSAPEIGRRLDVSAGTVKSHLQHLYEKLGVSDRAAAVAVAMRRGLLE